MHGAYAPLGRECHTETTEPGSMGVQDLVGKALGSGYRIYYMACHNQDRAGFPTSSTIRQDMIQWGIVCFAL